MKCFNCPEKISLFIDPEGQGSPHWQHLATQYNACGLHGDGLTVAYPDNEAIELGHVIFETLNPSLSWEKLPAVKTYIYVWAAGRVLEQAATREGDLLLAHMVEQAKNPKFTVLPPDDRITVRAPWHETPPPGTELWVQTYTQGLVWVTDAMSVKVMPFVKGRMDIAFYAVNHDQVAFFPEGTWWAYGKGDPS